MLIVRIIKIIKLAGSEFPKSELIVRKKNDKEEERESVN